MNNRRVKNLGQIFTPKHIVNCILDKVEYRGNRILKKHIIDNSCGDGAFLKEILVRYITQCRENRLTDDEIVDDLETYVHGIELDNENFKQCLRNLNSIAYTYGLQNIHWDILNDNAMDVIKYNNKMDYVVGNPPYVRVHNLEEQKDKVKNYNFCKSGMTNLFIIFYEIGFNMLSEKGKLGYITPNSCYNSIAANEFRKYINIHQHLYSIIDLGHYQPFENVMTYTTIMCFDNEKIFTDIEYNRFSPQGEVRFVCKIKYKELFVNGNILLTDKNKEIIQILNYKPKIKYVEVKNAFATLKDSFFIKKDFNFTEHVIDIIKASTGEWKKCFFPYVDGEPVKFDEFKSKKLTNYLKANEEMLKKRSLEKPSNWYLFGRSQGIKDVSKNKISINTTIKGIDSLKLNNVKAGKGVYSGLYILTNYSFDYIKTIIQADDFINYISSLNKCKSGGYFTYSSKDLSLYLNYQINKREKKDEQ